MARIKEFGENLTMHGGLARIALSKYFLSELFWSLLVLGSSAMLFYQIYQMPTSYINYSIITSVEEKVAQELMFPAVTVCPSSAYTTDAAPTPVDSDPPCIMCVQYRGVFSTVGGVQYRGGIS